MLTGKECLLMYLGPRYYLFNSRNSGKSWRFRQKILFFSIDYIHYENNVQYLELQSISINCICLACPITLIVLKYMCFVIMTF